MLTELIIVGSALVYTVGAGIFWVLATKAWGEPENGDAFVIATIGTAIWPLITPVAVGVKIGRWLTRPQLPKAIVHEREESNP